MLENDASTDRQASAPPPRDPSGSRSGGEAMLAEDEGREGTEPASPSPPAPSRAQPAPPRSPLGDLLTRDRALLFVALGLVFVAYGPTLVELVKVWWTNPEYSHGFLIPPIAAWVLWSRREDLATLRPAPSLGGLLLLVPCIAFLLLGEMKLSWFLKPYAFVGTLVGLLWTVYGWRAVRVCAPVIVVLLLMCPLPGRIQRWLTVPLKQYATLIATGLLDLSGVPVSLEGSTIYTPRSGGLFVADACSGISSLISLVSLAVIAAMFWKVPRWLRGVVVLSAVPVAIVVNGIRIWITGLITEAAGPDAAVGFSHTVEGFFLFLVGALLLGAWAALLKWLLVGRGEAATS